MVPTLQVELGEIRAWAEIIYGGPPVLELDFLLVNMLIYVSQSSIKRFLSRLFVATDSGFMTTKSSLRDFAILPLESNSASASDTNWACTSAERLLGKDAVAGVE